MNMHNLTHPYINLPSRPKDFPGPNPSGIYARKEPVRTSVPSTASGPDVARGTRRCRPTTYVNRSINTFRRGTSWSIDRPATIRRTWKARTTKTSTRGGLLHGEATTFGIPRRASSEPTAILRWRFIPKLTDLCRGTRRAGDRPWQG